MNKIVIIFTVTFICAMWFCVTLNNSEQVSVEPDIKFTDDLGYEPPEEQKKVKIEARTGIYLKYGKLLQSVDFINLSENKYDMKILIYLGDGTLLYESDFLSPGHVISEAKFRAVPKRGTYTNSLIVYKFYSSDKKHVYVSQCETPVEIKVI